MGKSTKVGYNKRLFESGYARRYVHLSRFRWLAGVTNGRVLRSDTVLDLGCFDGRSSQYIPKPLKYIGLDASWEQPTSLFESEINEFKYCDNPEDFKAHLKQVDVFVSLETLEHLNENILPKYLEILSESDIKTGFISVPNEIGLVFLVKQIVKRIFFGNEWNYTAKEFFYQFLGLVHKVERNQHKGFSYRNLYKELGSLFNVKMTSIHGRYWPLFLSSQIGFIITPK